MAKGLVLPTSGFKSPKRRNSAHDCMVFHCTEPFIIILPLSRYDLNNVEREVQHQTITETPLRKQAYSNILKILPPKNGNFQIKILIFFHISAQNIDRGYSLEPPRWGASNEYPQSMFLSKNKKNNVYPCKPQFYYIKVGFKGVNII